MGYLILNRLYSKTDLTPIRDKDVMAIHWYNGAAESKDYLNGKGSTFGLVA